MNRSKVVLGLMVIMLAATSVVYAGEMTGSVASTSSGVPSGASQIVAGKAVGAVTAFKAEVVAIDYDKREATIKHSDGTTKKIVVGEEAYNFDQVKVGDFVNVELKESLALFVDRMPSEPDANAATILARAPKGQKPEGVLMNYKDATATVTEIDYQKRNISLLGPEGETLTMNVPTEAAPNFDKIKKGDTVVLRYTMALAVKVEPAVPAKE